MKNIILMGKDAKEAVNKILDSENRGRYPLMQGTAGVFDEDGMAVAFDNRSGDCWVENFETAREALAWVTG